MKYHLGASGVRRTASGKEIAVSLASNPEPSGSRQSGGGRHGAPKQDRLGDTARERVIPLLIHGDAAFAGQGVVAETLNLSQLDGYTHRRHHPPVINNQIGFTTLPRRFALHALRDRRRAHGAGAHLPRQRRRSRSLPSASLQMAFDYRQQFKKDVVIDMICYRRHGHNEGDDPAYTQPIMYRKIKEQPSVAVLYGERLVRAKVLTAAEVAGMRKKRCATI